MWKPALVLQKPKRSKTEKNVDRLCSAYDADYAIVSDPTYNFIFSQDMLGDFCDDFLEAYGDLSRPVSGNELFLWNILCRTRME